MFTNFSRSLAVLLALSLGSCRDQLESVRPTAITAAAEVRTAASAPRVLVNGVPLVFDVAPYLSNGRTLAPATPILTRLGYTVVWEAAAQRLTATRGSEVVALTVDQTTATVGKTRIKLDAAPTVVGGQLLVPVSFFKAGLGLHLDWDANTASVQLYSFAELDYGLYFYGRGQGCQKFVAGQPNEFYDPSKPTIVYVHGWQPGTAISGKRESLTLDYQNTTIDTHDKWLTDNWNVAIFHWIQLADETYVQDAETKINSAAGNVGMRWKNADGALVTTGVPGSSVADLLADAFQAAFGPGYTGPEVRLVGHSLGGQLVMQTSLRLHERRSERMPSRIALIDPFWSVPRLQTSYSKPNGLTWTGDVSSYAGQVVSSTYNTAIEYYRSSFVTTLTTPAGLAQLAAFQNMRFAYTLNPVTKHIIGVPTYFWSRSFPAPAGTLVNRLGQRSRTGNVALSAATSNARVRETMGQANRPNDHWTHDLGANTVSPEDDTFKLEKGAF